jgi:PIN domain nuclease of toxin-antitoxin system
VLIAIGQHKPPRIVNSRSAEQPCGPDPKSWFSRFLDYPGVKLAPLTPEIAVASSFLPPLHADPADRLKAGVR